MLKQLIAIWKNNYGPQLFAVGSCVGLIMCGLWYLQLLPEVTFAEPIQLPRRLSWDSPTCYFVARIERIEPPSELNASDASSTNDGAVLVFVYDPTREEEYSVPVLRKEFTLDVDGTATVVMELRAGNYTAYAYLDSTKNDRLDVDDENGEPLEPMASTGTGELVGLKDLANGAFAVAVDRPYFRVLPLAAADQWPALE